jgi:TaqI-like C-terminal specificity domain/Eco57I restriction-modification methylase
MTRNELLSTIRGGYNRSRWLTLIRAILPNAEGFAVPITLDFSDDSIASAVQLGRIPLHGDRTVAIVEVTVTGQVDLQRNRVGLRNTVARFIGQSNADAVLAFFVGDSPDYRFSFAAKTNTFTPDGQLEQNETAPRRYTYLLGPGQACRTALERLELLRTIGARATLKDLVETFKVEPLFKEFYSDYGVVFQAVENLVRPSVGDEEQLRFFTQRLFNRLMFIAFIERKGWLRFGGRTDYLASLWADYSARRRTSKMPVNFYADRLVPLFFEGLNQADRPTDSIDPRFGSVPYLNGGLFEHAEDGTDKLAGLVVPDDAIALILDPESGLFSRYNFTVAESTPLEIQVAVDPEMLGKVFEELVTGRHEQGSYYTPKPIVTYMGRAALVEHLADRCPGEERSALEKFVYEHHVSSLSSPRSIYENLISVKICDPACGSGAYLLGMLHELLDLCSCIRKSIDGEVADNTYSRRLDIIEKNLYGVDLDPFAVNIARLRLWLALIVEFEGDAPPPLPNLDFKIEVGDALAAPAPQDIFQRPAVDEFRKKKSAFLRAHGEEKLRIKAELEHIRADLAHWQQADLSGRGFNWAIEFAEVFLPEVTDVTLAGELNLGHQLAAPGISGGFDIIVANPPYVRMELIKPQKHLLKRRFANVHAERADLYIYFFARAHELLRPGGVAAFITPNKWLKSGYGELLRRQLLDAQEVALIADFGDQKIFEGVAILCAITVWRKSPRSTRPTGWVSVRSISECYSIGIREYFSNNCVWVASSNFGIGRPRLATSHVADFRARMERSGPRLVDFCGGLIGRGIVTGFNDAFVINQLTRDRLIEETPGAIQIIKPLLTGDDLRRYEVHSRGCYLIYASHEMDVSLFPSIENYLRPFRSFINKSGKRVGLDHRATVQEWYELQQPQMAYREHFDGAKIVYPEIGKSARFVLESEGYYLNNKCFFLPSTDWFLLGVLNSTISTFALREVCSPLLGGVVEFRAQYLENLPIPNASDSERLEVSRLSERVQALHFRRRARSEQFIRSIGLNPSESFSRNPLEEPWTLTPIEYAKRARKICGRTPDMRLYQTARDEAIDLTQQIVLIETEIDARVAALYDVDASAIGQRD